jgi:TPR repeat protein
MATCTTLGMLYRLGNRVAQDLAKAAALFQKACDGGHMDGCVQLGLLYAEGDGVVKDAAKAKALFQKACDGGEPRACSAVQTPP